MSVAIGRWQAGAAAVPPSDSSAATVPAPDPRPPLQEPPLAAVPLLLTGGLALLIGLALGQRLPLASAPAPAASPPRPGLLPRPGLPPAGREPLRREVGRLCGDPALLVPSLHTRHSQVQGLRRGTLRPETLLIDSARDPLGALIAASFLEHHRDAGRLNGLQNELLSLGLCPALRSALGSLWLPATPPAIHPAMGATSSRPSP